MRRHDVRIFISYSHSHSESAALAEFLYKGLRSAGCEAFKDSYMSLGTDWASEIERRLAWCNCFVVLISESVLSSEMVQAEVRSAYQRKKREGTPIMLPVRVCFHSRLDYELDSYLGRLQCSIWETASDSWKVLEEIRSAIDASSGFSTGHDVQSAESQVDPRRPKPSINPRVLSPPGGTLREDDPFYLERRVDALARERAKLNGETIVIKAPRQMGKSSLLVRYLWECQSLGKRLAFLDLSLFSDTDLSTPINLMTEIASLMVRALRLNTVIVPKIERQMQFTSFIEDQILPNASDGLVIAFDEADRLLGRSFQLDFFSMLRAWHNKRAEPLSIWRKVDLALVISTEPYLLIDSGDRSPFNVTPALELEPFSCRQYLELNSLYGDPFSTPEVEHLHAFLGGHPYLGRIAFYSIVVSACSGLADLVYGVLGSRSPFADHLRALLLKMHKDKELLDSMRRISKGTECRDKDVGYRLSSAGLVVYEQGVFRPSNELYRLFFGGI